MAFAFTFPGALHAEGVVSPGFMFMEKADHQWAKGDAVLQNLTDAPKKASATVPILVLEIGISRTGRKEPPGFGYSGKLPALPYREIYVDAPPSEWGKLGIGIRDFKPRRGMLKGFVYIVPHKEVWSNPFDVGVKRDTSVSSTYGLGCAWQQIKQTGFSVAAQMQYVNVKDDTLHTAYPELGRTGINYSAEAAYRFKPSRKFSIIPGLSRGWADMNGEASNYTSTGPSMGFRYTSGKLIVNVKFFSASTTYGKTDPVFAQAREDESIGSSAFVVFPEVFQNKNLSLSMSATVKETDSNITFFDTSQRTAFIAMGLRI